MHGNSTLLLYSAQRRISARKLDAAKGGRLAPPLPAPPSARRSSRGERRDPQADSPEERALAALAAMPGVLLAFGL